MNEICVVHLIREKNGVTPFRKFTDSYLANFDDIGHRLLLVFKGFVESKDLSDYEQCVKGIRHEKLFIQDIGFDITSYVLAAGHTVADYYCFLNSFSQVDDNQWLTKLFEAVRSPMAGLVGATGSYQSPYTNAVYRHFTRFRPEPGFPESAFLRARLQFARLRLKPHFPEFPNHHIRTNAFMLSRDVLSGLDVPPSTTKLKAYRLESGYQSLSRQVSSAGKALLIAGRNGNVYEAEDWWRSGTFWQKNQENLLVRDNQTEKYADSDEQGKKILRYAAWGDHASCQ